jgi:hypothetical protein
MSSVVFWVVILCTAVSRYQRFGGTYCLLDDHLPSHVRNDMSNGGISRNGVSRYKMKKGSQHATKPPTTMDRVCAVLLSLLKEETRLVGCRGRDMVCMRMSTDVTSSARDSGRDELRL